MVKQNTADCVFCKIITHQIPGEILYQDDRITAFRDINPVAPTHILIVPNYHLNSVNEVETQDEAVLGQLFTVAQSLASQEGLEEYGYRLIVNTGPHAGQVVFHLHLHLIGGRPMHYPMG